MTPWPVALFMSIFLMMFAVSMLSFAIFIEGLLVARLVVTITKPKAFLGSVITAAIVGPFAYMFGSGALDLGAHIVDGWIARLS